MVVLFCFISVALDLALTLVKATFFIVISTFLLAFAVFPFTRKIAHHTIEVVLSCSLRLLDLYICIAAGQNVFSTIANYIPKTPASKF